MTTLERVYLYTSIVRDQNFGVRLGRSFFRYLYNGTIMDKC